MTTAPNKAAVRNPLPVCEDAERQVIGAVLIDSAALDEIAADAAGLRTADFFVPQHRAYWMAILRLHAEGTHIDTLTIVGMLRQMGFLDDVDRLTDYIGGAEPYLQQCFGETWSAAGVSWHANMVHRYAESRRMIEHGLKLVEQGVAVQGSGEVSIYDRAEYQEVDI